MKRSLLLLVLLVVLVGIYWLVQSKEPVAPPDRPFVSVDSAQVTSLRIETATDTVALAKRGGGWMLTYPREFPATVRTIDMALGKFAEMKKLSLITNKPDRFNEFQVSDSAGTKVTVEAAGKTTVFYLGKGGPTATTCYARLDGSNDVWEIAGNQTPTFKRSARDWRDKSISEINRDNFVAFTFGYPNETFSVTLVDTNWVANRGTEKYDADKNQVDRVVGLLSKMSGVDFADTLSASAFDQPDLHLTVETRDRQALDLKLIPKDEEGKQYFLRKAGALADYVIYKSTADVLMKKWDDFKPKPKTEAEVSAKK